MNASRLSGQSIVGLIVIVFGVILLLNTLGIAGVGYVVKAVPSLFIAFGVWQLVSSRFNRPVGPILMISVAAFIQLLVLDVSVGSLWPLILIVVGVAIMFGKRNFRSSDDRVSSDADRLNTLGVLGSAKRQLTTQAFKGGQVTAIMGSVEVDLRGAATGDSPATLEVNAIMGEVRLRVSPQWSVSIDPVTVMGDTTEERGSVPNAAERGPTLTITGLVFMGSLKITD